MQQPVVQQEQLGNQQQITQQMVLCPVRVVYETQILIPPGEQIQPNQTIFINPQNPPPWVQNRMQNQVLYVQQMPNIVSPIQQNIDQNQMFLQQNYSYQIPQMLSQERPMQIQNNFQNINTNIAANPNERLYMANIGQMQNQMKPQNVQILNNQVDMQRFLRPQVNQNYRPQVMVNPTQNLQSLPQMNVPNTQVTNTNITNVPSSNLNMNMIQNNPMSNSTVVMNSTNVGQIQPRMPPAANIRPIQQTAKVTNTVVDTNAINTTTTGVAVPNRLPVQQATRIGNMVFEHSVNNVNTIGNNIPRIQQHAYRPIHPRPQYRTNIPNVQTVAPVQNLPYYSQKPNQIQNYNVINNRKRKSESPDDSKQKIVAFESNVQTPNIINIKKSNEKGVNTSPVHKIEDRVQNSVSQIKMIDTVSQKIANDMKNNTDIIRNLPTTIVEKEKLVRNTVFTQARGRLLNDKQIQINEPISASNEHIINALNRNVTRQYANSSFNPTNVKNETSLQSNPIAVVQSEIPRNQNEVPVALSSKSMPIIENNTPINDPKLNDRQAMLIERNANLIKFDLNKNKDNINTELEDNSNKLTKITPNNINNNNLAQQEFSQGANNSGNINSPINNAQKSSNLIDALKAKIEENQAKAVANENLPNSEDTKIEKTQINETKPLLGKNSLENENPENTNSNANTSNISQELLTDNNKFTLSDIIKTSDDNVKFNACKVQLNSNEIQLNAGQIKNIQCDNGKIELNDSKSQLNDDITQFNDNKPQLDDKTKLMKVDKSEVKEEIMEKIVFKQEVYDQDILTHVLDGYVIQESNVAFPIRRPMREKTIYNQQTNEHKDDKDTKTPIDLPLLPFYYMHLKNEKVKEDNEKELKDELVKEKKEEHVDEVKKDEKGHPFSKLQQNTVKAWTVDQLTKHLYDQNWNETASIFQEHEIDGESLFLVSKSQLIQIGISEEHSDVICGFVHS